MAKRMTMALAVVFGTACAPAVVARADARDGSVAGSPDLKPMPRASAKPEATPAVSDGAAAPEDVVRAKEPIGKHEARMRWIEGPRGIPRSRMTVLEGNPKEPGAIYSVRVTVPAGTKLAPHTHPQDERVTVLEGSAIVGFGTVADEKGTRYKAGDYYMNPAGRPHFISFDEQTTLQMTGIGPWEATPVEK